MTEDKKYYVYKRGGHYHTIDTKPVYEKPVFVKRCKDFEVCESRKHYCCKGCNVWNYLYDIKALQKWCKEHGKDFMMFTMDMQKKLK